jgi:cytochrome c-type biogenesis protein CcmE
VARETVEGGRVKPRKRTTRLVSLLAIVVVLAGALVYTSFSSATEAVSPSKLRRDGEAGRSYQVTGKVVTGTIEQRGEVLHFRVRDRTGRASIPVAYTGTVPDAFRAGREVIVTVRRQHGRWLGEPDSLITKCPSKFKADE